MFPSDSDYDAKVTLETGGRELPDESPFRLLLLGDWSGRESRPTTSNSFEMQPIEIDRDNFDEVLNKLKVNVNLEFQGNHENALSIEFTELEDFHPDKIYDRLTLFSDLRALRRRLKNSDTFNEAAREVRSWYDVAENGAAITNPQQTAPEKKADPLPDDLLDQILARGEDEKILNTQSVESTELNDFVKNIAKPHLVQIDTAEQSELLMIVDEVISDVMRRILHHPRFQALESAWRGAHLLVKNIETSVDLRIYLLDVSKDELTDNLKSVESLTDSWFFKAVVPQNTLTSEDGRWAVILGNYTFSLNVEDTAALIRIAKIASDGESPFISYIKPEMFGFDSFAAPDSSDNWKVSEDPIKDKLWNTLRSVSEARYLGLALPRVLIRLPYGEKTEPTESFYFEEFTRFDQHEKYLWLNPAFTSALLLAQTFRQYGWDMSQNFFQDINNLPMHLYQDDGEDKTKPCAEILMTQNNHEKILEQGLIPLISYKNTDKVRLGEFRSVAYPASSLKGRWR